MTVLAKRPAACDIRTVYTGWSISLMRSSRPIKRCLFHAGLCAIFLAARAAAAEPQVTEGFINAPVAEVWRLFTTSTGDAEGGAAPVETDLRIGGDIPAYYDAEGKPGHRETFVNEILAFEPQRMLALRVKRAPASFPHREALEGLWTVLYFTASGEDMTHVRIVGLGYSDEPASLAVREFFSRRNRDLLDAIAKRYWPQCARCAAEPQGSGAKSQP